MSFGAANRMYNAVMNASADLNDAKSLRRRKVNEDEELEGQQRRALAKVEATMREGAVCMNRWCTSALAKTCGFAPC